MVVPEDSNLGPLFFTCYLLPLELIFVKFSVNYHFYADETVAHFVYNNNLILKFWIQYWAFCKNGLMVQNID